MTTKKLPSKTLLVAAALLLTACVPVDAIEKGIKTYVSGVVVDTVKDKVLPNVTVEAVGYAPAPPPLWGGSSKVFATAQTDKNGSFKLNFITDGYHVTYCIRSKSDNSNLVNHDEIVLSVGELNNIRLTARELSWLKARIIMTIPFPHSMSVSTTPRRYTDFDPYIENTNQVDTVLLFMVLPMSKVSVNYITRGVPWTEYSDTIDIAMGDTTHYLQTIDSAFFVTNFKPLTFPY